jgi:uncharacterized protein (TIGR02996 family)
MSASKEDYLNYIRHSPLDLREYAMFADYLNEIGHVARAAVIRESIWERESQWPMGKERTVLIRYDGFAPFRAGIVAGFARWVRLPCKTWLACGARICRIHPLTRVELSDKEPCAENREWASRCRWISSRLASVPASEFGDATNPAVLPDELYEQLPINHWDGEPGIATFRNKGEAADALSIACLAWVKQIDPAVAEIAFSFHSQGLTNLHRSEADLADLKEAYPIFSKHGLENAWPTQERESAEAAQSGPAIGTSKTGSAASNRRMVLHAEHPRMWIDRLASDQWPGMIECCQVEGEERLDLIRSILAEPSSNRQRMRYAEWLARHGFCSQAEMIRGMVEESRPRGGWTVLMQIDDHPIFTATFQRGFAEEVRLPLGTWLSRGPRLVQGHPLTSVILSDREPFFEPGSTIRPRYRWLVEGQFRINRRDVLPRCLIDNLPTDTPQTSPDAWAFESDVSAQDALSNACLAWARNQAAQH